VREDHRTPTLAGPNSSRRRTLRGARARPARARRQAADSAGTRSRHAKANRASRARPRPRPTSLRRALLQPSSSSSIVGAMPTWTLIMLLALIKLPIAAMMLWVPFRNDAAMNPGEPPDRSDDDGGSRALPAGPLDPRPRRPLPSGPFPRRPRRGPHGSPPPPSPRRVRIASRGMSRRVRVSH
jgi:hypothetical protein